MRKKRQTEGDEHVSKKPKLRATSRGTTTGQTGEGKVAVQKPAKKLTAAMAKQTIDEDEVMETTESEQDEDRAKSETEDEKPEIVAAARKKVQTTLIAKNEKDPYPDWPNGDPVPYAALCTAFSLIEMTTKRLQIMAYCTAFLLQVLRLTPGDLLPVTQLMVNKIASDYAGIELGIGESLIMKAIGESSGRPLQKIKDDQHKIGDLGLVAAKSRSNQRSLWGAKPKQLTVRGVLESLLAIATTKGEGAQGAKVSRIRKLLSGADALQDGTKTVDITEPKGGASEAKFIVRTLEGKMRLGLAERTVLVSLAQAMVSHELRQNGQSVSEEKLKQGEAILKQVYRFVTGVLHALAAENLAD